MSIRRIVAAVDGSEPARQAAARAVALAGVWGAELTLVHVYETGPAETASMLTAERIVEESRRAGEASMRSLLEGLGRPELPTRVRPGRDVTSVICDAAHELDADLVVLSTIGRTGAERFFMGSVAEGVVRRAPCPVWVERGAGATAGSGEVSRILVCTDLSPASEAALAFAAGAAPELGADVEVVYALEPPFAELSPEVQAELTGELRGKLQELATRYFADRATARIVEGANVVDGIVEHATRSGTDLLVVATHGRTGLRRVLTGSVAERVARFAPCSVLVARSAASRA